ncbi:hypothetical protein [Sulfurimonas sp.]|uniref:hypothetical protein n=1 Tax=Sulfurimonas sp. TaxID=2022749 RepID=UPI002B47D145|nr:hypothetical protein [Sulfurimonas sp.]
MIHNPLLTLDAINENKKTLKKNIFNEIQSTLRATGIHVTPASKKEIDEKINLFVYDVYTNQCKYRHYLNTKDLLCSPEDL